MQMLLTGDMIPAETALAYGLLNAVVSPDSLESETSKLAEKLSSKSSFGIRLGKKMFYPWVLLMTLQARELAVICNTQMLEKASKILSPRKISCKQSSTSTRRQKKVRCSCQFGRKPKLHRMSP
jgi:hypothetical protein